VQPDFFPLELGIFQALLKRIDSLEKAQLLDVMPLGKWLRAKLISV